MPGVAWQREKVIEGIHCFSFMKIIALLVYYGGREGGEREREREREGGSVSVRERINKRDGGRKAGSCRN